MIFYDGTYTLGSRLNPRRASNRGRNQSWRIRIIDFTLDRPDIQHLKPYAVVVTPSQAGPFEANCASSLGRRILRDFNLKIEKTLWIEQFRQDPHNLQVAMFTAESSFGPDTYYRINWRPLLANERIAIKPFIAEAEAAAGAR